MSLASTAGDIAAARRILTALMSCDVANLSPQRSASGGNGSRGVSSVKQIANFLPASPSSDPFRHQVNTEESAAIRRKMMKHPRWDFLPPNEVWILAKKWSTSRDIIQKLLEPLEDMLPRVPDASSEIYREALRAATKDTAFKPGELWPIRLGLTSISLARDEEPFLRGVVVAAGEDGECCEHSFGFVTPVVCIGDQVFEWTVASVVSAQAVNEYSRDHVLFLDEPVVFAPRVVLESVCRRIAHWSVQKKFSVTGSSNQCDFAMSILTEAKKIRGTDSSFEFFLELNSPLISRLFTSRGRELAMRDVNIQVRGRHARVATCGAVWARLWNLVQKTLNGSISMDARWKTPGQVVSGITGRGLPAKVRAARRAGKGNHSTCLIAPVRGLEAVVHTTRTKHCPAA